MADLSDAEGIRVPLLVTPGERQVRLMLLGAVHLANGHGLLILPAGSQRLLAFLAVRGRVVTRAATAGALWPDATDAHALASLRSSLARLDPASRGAVQATRNELELDAHVSVDIREARALADRLLVVGNVPLAADASLSAVTMLSSDLLPDMYDDWALIAAEDWRQLRLHALDALARHLSDDQRFADATRAALAAVSAEPLRETANATLIHVHLAEGNPSEAFAAFARYRTLLREELGIDVSPLLRELMRKVRLSD
jgi:DNA-binding SARP family transcriptional activator